MQLIVHAPFGSRLNRAWGLALRKRFCRTFNFELQAAANENALILSLGTSQSFPLEGIREFLKPSTVRDVLVQALLDAPMFTVRWRWNAVCSLAIKRFHSGRKTPPHLLRMQAEDLVTSVFPDQLACLENIAGAREIPDHPLVQQTIHDCLTEAMDIERLVQILGGIDDGSIGFECREVTEASALAAGRNDAGPPRQPRFPIPIPVPDLCPSRSPSSPLPAWARDCCRPPSRNQRKCSRSAASRSSNTSSRNWRAWA
jgi:ATP-dependent Lhr-like helicase